MRTLGRVAGLIAPLAAAAFGLIFAGAARPTAAPSAPAAVHRVLIVADGGLEPPAAHGLSTLEDALRAHGVAVSRDATTLASADVVVMAGLGSGSGPAAAVLAAVRAPVPSAPEGLTVRSAATYRDKPAIVLAGGDANGVMYAALDTADRVAWAPATASPFQLVHDTTESPFLQRRGVVIFTMNRAYFESRLYDEKYWARYFDMLADDRINQIVVTFGYENGGYMAPPYPYFFDVDGFPDVKVVGLTPEQQAHNLAAFKTMLRLATERGIRVKAGIWDHIYRGGVQGGGLRGASDGTKPTAGLVWGVNATNLVPYTVAALKKFYAEFPDVAETQFRMHTESGLRQNEIEPFWHDIFGYFSKDKRDQPLELRIKELPKSVVRDAQSQGLTISLDTKIWMEQMGLPFHPTHINAADQANSRHSYADFLEYPQTYHMDWTLWNGGTQRLLLWGDPDYARRMASNARLYDGQVFAVTEMEATKMLGDGPDVVPRDYLNAPYRYTEYEFERYWDFYRLWGRLSYNPQTASEVWSQEFVRRFGASAAPHVMKALELSSRVLPRIVAASYRYQLFPTTTGWAEMMHMGSLPSFAQQEEPSDTEQFLNVRDEATRILHGEDTSKRRPEDVSRWFRETSDGILAEATAAERAAGAGATKELRSTLTDARILAGLARYHAARDLGGVNYNLYKQSGDVAAFDAAIENERAAVQAWRDIVTAAGDVYIDDLVFGARNFPRHWKGELAALETEFTALQAERQTAPQKPAVAAAHLPVDNRAANSPVVTLQPASAAVPGQPVTLRAKVTAPNGVRTILLRYRHLNQTENYQTAEMTLDRATGVYTGTIPGSFVTAQWDLMYYVAVIDGRGAGRQYPDLDRDTPYVVIGVRR